MIEKYNERVSQKRWLTPNELFREYLISESTQAKYRMERKIPFSKIGKYVRYDRVKIEQWLEDNAVEVIAS